MDLLPLIKPTNARVVSILDTEWGDEDAPGGPAISENKLWEMVAPGGLLLVPLPWINCSVKYRKEREKRGNYVGSYGNIQGSASPCAKWG